MNLRTASPDDLPVLIALYQAVVRAMHENHVPIWDDVYPCGVLKDDIEKERLYLLTDDGGCLVAAFALCAFHDGEHCVQWAHPDGKPLYVDRLAVHPGHGRQGIGSMALSLAARLARQHGDDYLRLFVVDINQPAISLYRKNGFIQAAGTFEEIIDRETVLREYGFEAAVDRLPAIG